MADITKINLNGTELTIVDSAATSAIAGEIARAQGAESAITSALSAEVVARQSAVTAIEQTLSGKQDTLTAGTGIQISGNVISCTVDTGLYVVVQTLPAQPAAGNENKIHLVPLASGQTSQNDQYEEYLWKGTEWEYLGVRQAEIDLSDYWTSAQTQSAITDALGSGVVEEGSVENVFASAGIVGYETDDETGNEVMVVNSMATEDWIGDFVGGSLIEALGPGTAEEDVNTIEDIFIQSNIATIEFDDELEKDVVIVNPMATEDYVDNALSGITASYSAATETLILNIPNPSA